MNNIISIVADGKSVLFINEILLRKINTYCKNNNLKLRYVYSVNKFSERCTIIKSSNFNARKYKKNFYHKIEDREFSLAISECGKYLLISKRLLNFRYCKSKLIYVKGYPLILNFNILNESFKILKRKGKEEYNILFSGGITPIFYKREKALEFFNNMKNKILLDYYFDKLDDINKIDFISSKIKMPKVELI